MWTLTLGIRGHVSPVVFQFTSQPRAMVAYQAATQEGFNRIELTDDHGKQVSIAGGLVDYAMLQDTAKVLEGQRIGEIMMLKSQAETFSKAMADPVVRNAQASRSPSVMMPRG